VSHRTERRRRKKARERIDLLPPPVPPLDVREGRYGDIALFAEPKSMLADMRVVRRAIRDDWDVPEKMRAWLPDALMEVVSLPLAKSGVDESTLDRNATAACRTIVAMEAVNMRRQHAELDRLLANLRSTSKSGQR
jgi:hypothetical protein